MINRRQGQRKTLIHLDYSSFASPGPFEGMEETRSGKCGGIWKVMESRDSRESFPEGNGAIVAALNLEVIFFSPCSGEPASENFFPELYSPFHLGHRK